MNAPLQTVRTAVREATDDDIAAITAIYAEHVRTGLASFEETPPAAAEMAARRQRILARALPYLVFEHDDSVIGFAYAGAFRDRSAYRYTVEDSVYVAAESRHRGVGRALLAALIERCAAAGYRQMVAVIGDSANTASIGLHAALGFRLAGVVPSAGFKLGRWVDCVMMVRPLGEGDRTPPGSPAR